MSLEWMAAAGLAGIANAAPASAALASATALLTRVGKLNASTRYGAWWLCLIAILAAPLLRVGAERRERADIRMERSPARVAAAVAVSSGAVVRAAPIPVVERRQERAGITIAPRAVAGVASILWAAGVLWSLVRLLRAYAWMRRARSRCMYRDQERLERCLALCPVKRRVRLGWSAEADAPIAAGFRRAAILLPERMAGHLSEREIDEIVIHELAHLARRDDWMQLVERLIAAVFWFHPLVRIALRRIAVEREMCCDDWVIRSGGGVRSYAGSLLKLAELRQAAHVPVLATAAAGGKAEVSRRIEALLGSEEIDGNKTAGRTRISGMRLTAMAAVLSVLGGAGAQLPKLVKIAAPSIAAAPVAFAGPPQAAAPPAKAPPASAKAGTAQAASAQAGAAQTGAVPARAAQAGPPQAGAPKGAPAAAAAGKSAPAAASPAKAAAPAGRPSGLLAALTATGYGDLSVDEIIDLKNNGVTAEFLFDVHEAGMKLSTADLIRLKHNNLKPSYLREMKTAYPELTIGDAIEFQNNGVKTTLAAAIQMLGYGPYTPREMIDMSVNGLNAEFFEALKEYGIKQIDAKDAVRARQHGVNRRTLAEARQYGPSLTIAQIIKLKSAGVI